MAEKIRKSEQKKHKSKRKRKKRCSHSDDENLTVETPNCKERLRSTILYTFIPFTHAFHLVWLLRVFIT